MTISTERLNHIIDNPQDFSLSEVQEMAMTMLDIHNVLGLLEEHEWAEHCTKTELGQRLEAAVTKLVGNIPAEVKLPTTRLWAGVTECFEKSDVISAIRAAGAEVSNE